MKMNGSMFEFLCFRRSPLMSSNSAFGKSSSEHVSPSASSPSFTSNKGKPQTARNQHDKCERKANSLAFRIREHASLYETLKGKLSVGTKIIKKGGRQNIFREIFGVTEGEKVLKASQCYLSTTTGPIAGILFISTQKISFCSERPITLHLTSGGIFRTLYKLSVPVKKIKEAHEGENMNNPAQKYIEIVAEEGCEFWFMGFVRYEKAFMNLQKAISLSI